MTRPLKNYLRILGTKKKYRTNCFFVFLCTFFALCANIQADVGVQIKNTGLFKPYAIIDQKTFDAEIQNLKK